MWTPPIRVVKLGMAGQCGAMVRAATDAYLSGGRQSWTADSRDVFDQGPDLRASPLEPVGTKAPLSAVIHTGELRPG